MSDANPTAEDMADQDEPDDQPAMSNVSEPDAQQPDDGAGAPAESPADTGSKLVAAVEYATFGILCLLALVATFRFYFAASSAIRIWFSSDFVPVFQAVFNLVVLVLTALGISVLVRRIS